MTKEVFGEQLKKKSEEIEQMILLYLPKVEGFQKKIMDAMHYSLTAGGKRLRPLMMQESCFFFNGKKREHLFTFK